MPARQRSSASNAVTSSASQENLAAVAAKPPRDQPEHRTLSGAVGTDHADEISFLDGKAEIRHHHHGAIAFADATKFEQHRTVLAALEGLELALDRNLRRGRVVRDEDVRLAIFNTPLTADDTDLRDVLDAAGGEIELAR